MFEGSADGSVGALLRARRKRMQTRLALRVVLLQQHNTVSSCIERNDVKSGCVHVMFEGSANGSVGALLRTRRKRMQTRLALHVVLCSSTTQCHLASTKRREKRTRARHV